MVTRASTPVFVSERTMPFMFGICMTGTYYWLCRTTLKGTPLKAYVIGLGITSLSASFRFENEKFNKISIACQLALAMLVLRYTVSSKNIGASLAWGAFTILTIGGTHILAEKVIQRKRSVFPFDSSLFDSKTVEMLDKEISKREAILHSLAYFKDWKFAQEILDDLKFDVCQIFSVMKEYDRAEKIAKSISNQTNMIRALISLGKNDPDRLENLLAYANEHVEWNNEIARLEFEVEKRKPKKTNRILIPPENVDRSGIERSAWAKIQNVFTAILEESENYFQFEEKNGKKEIIVHEDFFESSNKLPWISKFNIIKNEPLQFILNFKKCIGKGGQRSATVGYNLTTGDFYVIKDINHLEKIAINSVSTPPNRGLPRLIPVEVKKDETEIPELSFDHKIQEITEIYEPLFDHTLQEMIERELLKSRQLRLVVIERILEAVSNFHQHTINGLSCPSVPSSDAPQEVDLSQLQAYHGDIKPSNIVINEDTFEVMLINLGQSCEITAVSGTLFYLDPSIAKKYRPRNPFSPVSIVAPPPDRDYELEMITYHQEHGQARDVWAAALVIGAILFGMSDDKVNLSFIENCSKTNQSDCFYLDSEALIIRNIASLNQSTIDSSLDKIGEESKEPLIPLLKEMFRVDPATRISSQEALNQFRQIIGSTYSL